MADRRSMWDDNVLDQPNPDLPVFYVDTACIVCSVCADAAPGNFAMSRAEDHNRVIRQPADAEELDRCVEALENCPVEAIGRDGRG